MGKKIVALVLALVMALSLCTTAFAATYYKINSINISSEKCEIEVLECEKATVNCTIRYTVSTNNSSNGGYSKDSTSLKMYWAVYADGASKTTDKGNFTKSKITSNDSYEQPVSVTGLTPGTKYTMYLNTSSDVNKSKNVASYTFTTLSHDIATVTNYEYKAPTCTEAGNEALYQCKNCNNYYSDLAGATKVMLDGMPDAWKTTLPDDGGGKIDATHTLATVTDYKAPTCVETGNKALYKCSVCNKYFDNENNEVEASKVASWTSVAGKLDKIDHNWNDWTASGTTLSHSCQTDGCTAEESVILSLNPTTPSVGSNLSAYIGVSKVGNPGDVTVTYEKWTGSKWSKNDVTANTTSKNDTYYRASITKDDATVSVVFPKCYHERDNLTSLETSNYNTSMQSTVKATCFCGWTSTAKLDWNAAKNGVIFVNGDPKDTWTAEDVAFWNQFTIYYATKSPEVTEKHDYHFSDGSKDYSSSAQYAFMAEKQCANYATWTNVVCNHHQPILKLVEPFTVTFDTNGGTTDSPITSQAKFYGAKVAAVSNPTKGKLLFDGWYNGTTKWDFSTTTVTTNTDLIAKYYAKVTFDKNGAAGTTTPTNLSKVYEGSKISAPTNGLTKTGYDFEGWYYLTGGKYAKWNFNTAIASNTELDENGVLTLYAGWTQVKHEATTTDFTPAVVGDVKANFTVPGGSYEQLLTSEEQAAIENEGNSYELILNVETPNASATDVANELGALDTKRGENETLAFQADISLTKIAKDVMGDEIGSPTDITKTNKTIRVTIDVPNDVWATLTNVPHGYSRTIYVNRAHTDGDKVDVEKMNNVLFDKQNGTLSFDTNQFSVYEITYVDTKISHPHAHYIVNSVKTGDSGVLLYGVLAVSSLMGMGYFRSRREDEM